MIKNYFKIAFRNLLKHKGFSFINISGLAIGMTCTIFILLYVQYELSYDRFHENADRIYRIFWTSENPQTRTPHPMAQAMRRDFPEVVNAVSISPIWGSGLTRAKLSVRYEDRRFDEAGFFSADSTFFDLFSFKLLAGDPKTALKIPGGVVITEEIAHKYFGDEDALGKSLILEVSENFPLKVTGVMENIPANSHFTIRKVLGASVVGIVRLLSKEYVILVLLANLVAWPIAYLVMNNWLQEFAYRIHISWPTFLFAGVLALAIAIVTVSMQAIKAALANPVEALRYE